MKAHTMWGAGKTEESGDMQNRQSHHRPGESSAGRRHHEYRQYIEKDAALERRFQPVMVSEPSVEDTIAILRGLKERYEVFHGENRGGAIIAALPCPTGISHRFLPDRPSPAQTAPHPETPCPRAGCDPAEDHQARDQRGRPEKGDRPSVQNIWREIRGTVGQCVEATKTKKES